MYAELGVAISTRFLTDAETLAPRVMTVSFVIYYGKLGRRDRKTKKDTEFIKIAADNYGPLCC